MKSWQIPISGQSIPASPACWFERVRKNPGSVMVKSACGKWVNPAFARIARKGHPQCKKCLFALAKEGK